MRSYTGDPRAKADVRWNRFSAVKRLFASTIAICGWCALSLQFYLTVSGALSRGVPVTAAILTYFSFFTILTNILVALCLTFVAVDSNEARFWNCPSTVAGLTLYIIVVAIVYAAVLQGLWNPEGLQLIADRALHDVIPICLVAYWLIFVPKGSLRWADPLLWLPYPFLYMGAILARGAATGRYPYPFLNVRRLGYSGVWFNGALLLGLFVGLGLLLVFVDRSLHSRLTRETNF